MSVEIPHLAFPLRVETTLDGQGQPVVRGVAVDQDSPQHLADQVEIAALTRQGWRIEEPDFGIPSYLMRAGGVDLDELRAALAQSVPNAPQIVDLVEDLAETLTTPDTRHQEVRVLIEQES